jgi:acyl carrier protein
VSDTEFTVPKLKEHLSEKLPDYMRPSEFVQIGFMPLLPNGKVDRKALDSRGTRLGTGKEYVPPKNKIVKIIADVWKETLHLDKISIHDNFFDLGGDSLVIMKVMGNVGAVLKREIAVVRMYQYPTIHSLSAYLSENEDESFVDIEREQINQMEAAMKETVQLFDAL